jgi:sterol desaturase/sphingolipid hydroxylase (fatty acid hydroxylase superfamily)
LTQKPDGERAIGNPKLVRPAPMSAPVSLEIFLGFLIFAVVFVPLERCFPHRRQPVFRPGWTIDVTYYVAGCLMGHLSDAASLGAMLLIRRVTGPSSTSIAALQPEWAQLLEIVIMSDLLVYLSHRCLHRFPFLWRFHRVHHSSRQMDWLANVRLHPVDKLFEDSFKFIPIFWVGFADMPVLAYTILLTLHGFLNHSNVNINFGFLRWIIASPQFHHWHHANDPDSYNKNFAPHLAVFDLLFGTAYLPAGRSMPNKYGIAEAVPESFWGQMIYPLRKTDPASPTGFAKPHGEALPIGASLTPASGHPKESAEKRVA